MKKTSATCEQRQSLNLVAPFGSADSRGRSEVTVHRVIVAPVLCGNGSQRATRSGPLYTASYLGEVIVTRSTQPALDAARVLHARELTGLLEMLDEVSATYRFRIGINKAAKLTIEEGDRRPHLVKFKSFDGRDVLEASSGQPGVTIAPQAKCAVYHTTSYCCS